MGFNYVDRKTTRNGKIWAKSDKPRIDTNLENTKFKIQKTLREGILCKNIKTLTSGIDMVRFNNPIKEELEEEVACARKAID